MKGPWTVIGIVLLVLGLISFAYQGITYTKSEKILEVGPITASKETKKTIPRSWVGRPSSAALSFSPREPGAGPRR